MEVITKASKIDETLVNLMKRYNEYYIATAWASLGSKASNELLKNVDRIKQMIVGTHFYQTHPAFIEKFVDSDQVKFILKTNGIYHPKVYLFVNKEDDWECVIGSANFTMSALTKNCEIVAHLKSSDPGSSDIYNTLLEAIDGYWVDAETITKDEYQNYKNIWEKNRKKIGSLEGEYAKVKNQKSLVKSKVFSRSWSDYFELIKNDKFHSFEGRLNLLSTVQGYFRSNSNFSVLNELQRREVAGIATSNQSKSSIDWRWFGSMVGAGKFQNRINTNNIHISNALDSIPLHGKVSKVDYNNFVSEFYKAFPNGGSGVAIASRLLAMKRPDYFVCLDKQNRSGLCADFGVQKKVTFEGYWDSIIEIIIDSVWWASETPVDEIEAKAWAGRAAMLDVIYYEV